MSGTTLARRSSRREVRRRRELEARRRDALAAATEVFAEKGFHDAPISEIAVRAEVSLASLYSMFEGKEALYQEVMRRAAERLSSELRARAPTGGDPASALDSVIDAFFDYFERNRGLLGILLAGTRGVPWKVRERMGQGSKGILDELYLWLVELCRAVVRERGLDGIDPEALCASVVGSVVHLAAWELERHPETALTEAASSVRGIFSRVLAVEAVT